VFDRIVVVDWSASSTPKQGADSIWLAIDDGHGRRLVNPSTRRAAAEELRGVILDGASTLVCVDFSVGFPAGTAARLELTGVPWRAIWDLLADEIVDGGDNRNNRFAVAASWNERLGGGPGPFWGCPHSVASEHLTTTRPPTELPTWRAVETALRSAGRRPFSAWQLLGAGAVGSQSLLGIPVLHALLDDAAVDVWPFTTGLVPPTERSSPVVVAEVWPSMLALPDPAPRPKDAAQVEAVAAWVRRLAATGDLTAAFAPTVDATVHRAAVDEEGWVLGVAADGSVVGRTEAAAGA
jgi:precorrin-8X/cobalt-precorrin-8 methylmutase